MNLQARLYMYAVVVVPGYVANSVETKVLHNTSPLSLSQEHISCFYNVCIVFILIIKTYVVMLLFEKWVFEKVRMF